MLVVWSLGFLNNSKYGLVTFTSLDWDLGLGESRGLGHTVDLCFKAQMGLGIMGLYISPPLIRVWLSGTNQGTRKAAVTCTT